MSEYRRRDHAALDALGGYFGRHIYAMLVEGLHSKSDIAGELAWRDSEIDRLRSELADLIIIDLSEDEATQLAGAENQNNVIAYLKNEIERLHSELTEYQADETWMNAAFGNELAEVLKQITVLESERDEARAEVERLKHYSRRREDFVRELIGRVDELEQEGNEIERLRIALLRYGTHDDDSCIRGPCTCGLTGVMESTDE